MKPVILALSLLLFSTAFASRHSRALPPTGEKFHPDTATFCIDVERISDIKFRDQEYTIHFWLMITYGDTSFHFEDQLQIIGSKMTKIVRTSNRPIEPGHNRDTVELKITCVMAQNWEIARFPFGAQRCLIAMYNSAFDSRRLILKSDGDGIHQGDVYPESEWALAKDTLRYGIGFSGDGSKVSSDSVASDVLYPHSILSYAMILDRKGSGGLASKLFIGMYIAFLVAFVALFIPIERVEPRFGLPVGALFAAIANKYVVEALLPQSPDFSSVDSLHTLSIVGIFLVIAFSVVSLKLFDEKIKRQTFVDATMRWIDKRGWVVVIILYALGNAYVWSQILW
jgi:hypothetical protein